MRICEVCVALLYCPPIVIQSSLYDAAHTLNCSTPALFYSRLCSALIWKPVYYHFIFPNHSGFFPLPYLLMFPLSSYSVLSAIIFARVGSVLWSGITCACKVHKILFPGCGTISGIFSRMFQKAVCRIVTPWSRVSAPWLHPAASIFFRQSTNPAKSVWKEDDIWMAPLQRLCVTYV